jgi:hypothetical protein
MAPEPDNEDFLADDDDPLEDTIRSVVEEIAAARGISPEELDEIREHLRAGSDADADEDFARRCSQVIRTHMKSLDMSEEQLANKAQVPGGRIFDGESLIPKTAGTVWFRIPWALGIEPADFAAMVDRQKH